jgi:hypothetical protein
VVGSSLALAGALIERGEWEDVRALAGLLAAAGEESAATELRIRLGGAVWEAHREQLRAISNNMPPAASSRHKRAAGHTARGTRGIPRPEQGDQLLPAAAGLGRTRHYEETRGRDSYHSRVEHIATGGVAKYPDIVKTSLDELAAEFDGICRRTRRPNHIGERAWLGLSTILRRWRNSGRT